MDQETVKAWIILLVPFLYAILEALKKAGVDKRYIPIVNALLALLAGGGAALLERQDLGPAVAQIVILFLMTAGAHDRLQKLWQPATPEKITPVYYPKGSEPKPEGFTFWRDLAAEDYPAGNAMDPTGESEGKETI